MSWENKLPSKDGILCWVWNGGTNLKRRAELIQSKEGGTFCYSGGYSYHAEPVSEFTEIEVTELLKQQREIIGDIIHANLIARSHGSLTANAFKHRILNAPSPLGDNSE